MSKDCPNCGTSNEPVKTFSIGNNELNALPWIDETQMPCRNCGKLCDVDTGYDVPVHYNDETPDGTSISTIRCHDCKKTYLVGLNGKKLKWEED